MVEEFVVVGDFAWLCRDDLKVNVVGLGDSSDRERSGVTLRGVQLSERHGDVLGNACVVRRVVVVVSNELTVLAGHFFLGVDRGRHGPD